ncbi:MAG: hypothetical protein V2G42_06930 [bacterium JZ-2024 1]
MEDHTIAERSSAYRRKAWKEYLKGLSPCARAGLERLQASRDVVNAERAEAVPNRLSADLQGVHLPEANQATSQGARNATGNESGNLLYSPGRGIRVFAIVQSLRK